nr:MAG TPA: hypothetical protein [Caudoviricetes sp.]
MRFFLLFNSKYIIQQFPKINNTFPKTNFLYIFFIFLLTNGNRLDIYTTVPKNKQHVPKNKLFIYIFYFSVDKREQIRYTIIVLRNK